VLFRSFALFLNLLLENCDSLLHIFRGLVVLLFQFLELLLQISILLGGCARLQKHHNADYCNSGGIESAAHALTHRLLKPRDPSAWY